MLSVAVSGRWIFSVCCRLFKALPCLPPIPTANASDIDLIKIALLLVITASKERKQKKKKKKKNEKKTREKEIKGRKSRKRDGGKKGKNRGRFRSINSLLWEIVRVPLNVANRTKDCFESLCTPVFAKHQNVFSVA